MKKSKILLVEDDESLGFVIKDNLEQHGFEVDLAEDGEKGMAVFHTKNYDICILDVMLPKKDGFTLASEIRESDSDIPIIFLTAKGLKEDRIKGFKLGGDDYITKPFSIEELILRITVFLKRNTKNAISSTQKLLIGTYIFNYDKLLLSHQNANKTLTQREADLLKILLEQQNKTVSRETILTQLWGDNDYFKGRSMDVFISKLRKYLNADKNINIINIHGVGFRLDIEKLV